MPYYALYIPAKGAGIVSSGGHSTITAPSSPLNNNSSHLTSTESHHSPFVFHKKCEALDVLKKHRDARLKEFLNEEEAIRYAQTGYEIVQNKHNDNNKSTSSSSTSSSSSSSSTTSGEKAAFRAPSKHDLIAFRKVIEAGDCERVKTMIWENPLYLVSPGDTPTTLKEGYRYNAMHVCAITKRPLVAKLILETVSDPKFTDLLTGHKGDRQICEELCANLLDYYLNIPEKGRSETPLHLAAKNGCLEMVEVLTSYSQCKMIRNNDNLLPKDIICDRVCKPNPDLVKKIDMMLNERFFVPVIRCNDGSIPPKIGQPFPAHDPPNLNADPMSPEVEIRALAGPMNKEQAKQFFRRWKTPPRIGSSRTVSTPIANQNSFISPSRPQRSSSFSGLYLKASQLSNTIPQDEDKEQRSYSFNCPQEKQLNGFLRTPKILKQIDIVPEFVMETVTDEMDSNTEKYEGTTNLYPSTPVMRLKKDAFFTYRDAKINSPMLSPIGSMRRGSQSFLFDQCESPSFKERHIKNTDTEKGLECIGRELAKERNVEWREYWDFLDEFIDISSVNGLQKLENYLGNLQRIKATEQDKNANDQVSSMLDNVCSALDKMSMSSSAITDQEKTRSFRNGLIESLNNVDIWSVSMCGFGGTKSTTNQTSSSSSSSSDSPTPYTYVEKSLEVHARRITKTIVHNIDSAESIYNTLLLELKRIKSLIYSFKQDKTFTNVNFCKVHSRIGNLVTIFLMNSQENTATVIANIIKTLSNLLNSPKDRREHLECVCKRIKTILESPTEQILPENLKTEEMCRRVWSTEEDCACQWESSLSRKTSRRNRIEAILKQHQHLHVDEDNNCAKLTAGDDEKISAKDNVALLSGGHNDEDTYKDVEEEEEEEEFWSDFGSEIESDDEENDVWATPPETRSRMSPFLETSARDDDKQHKIFIFGEEPTKRDLDVLNAIFHVELDSATYPHIAHWKRGLMRFTNDEMDYFPSPRVVRKVDPSARLAGTRIDHILRTPQLTRSSSYHTLIQQKQQQQQLTTQHFVAPSSLSLNAKRLGMWRDVGRKEEQLPMETEENEEGGTEQVTTIRQSYSSVKRLFMSPKSIKNEKNVNSAELCSLSDDPKSLWMQQHSRRPLTPMNKLRGLFSAYREPVTNISEGSSGTSTDDSAEHKLFGDHDELSKSTPKNLSLLNISTFK